MTAKAKVDEKIMQLVKQEEIDWQLFEERSDQSDQFARGAQRLCRVFHQKFEERFPIDTPGGGDFDRIRSLASICNLMRDLNNQVTLGRLHGEIALVHLIHFYVSRPWLVRALRAILEILKLKDFQRNPEAVLSLATQELGLSRHEVVALFSLARILQHALPKEKAT